MEAVMREITAEERDLLSCEEFIAVSQKKAREFREALCPFGLDKFVLRDEPKRILHLPDGRMLAEFRTMPLPLWQPEKLRALEESGFEVIVFIKKYNKHAPQQMYYVRTVQEIWREKHETQCKCTACAG